MQITLVKLGGSIITDKTKPYTFAKKQVKRLARELATHTKPLLVAHGAGSFAHTSAQKYGGLKGYVSKFGFATVARDAMALNALVIDELLGAKLPVISFRPMSFLQTDKGKTVASFFLPIQQALLQGFTPVVYGDGIWDITWQTTIYSGEKVLSEIASFLLQQHVTIDKVIEVGTTNGVYDNTQTTISHISTKNWKDVQKHVLQSEATDVTGGMQHKVSEATLLAKRGIPTFIINGLIPGELQKALSNQPTKGTIIS